MAVAFPNGLPAALISGYSGVDESAVRFNNVETGPARFELLSEDVPSVFKVNWFFQSVDFQIFEGWWKNDLLRGALDFDLDLTVGAGFLPHTCFFLKPYTFTMAGKKFRVKAELLAIEKQFVTPALLAELQLLRDNIDGDVENWANQFNKIVEINLPNAFPA